MENKIICIGREFGSGGHEIAILLSKRFGIKVYEKELLHLACSYGEVAVKILEGADEKATNPYLFQTVHEGNYRVARGCLLRRFSFSYKVMRYTGLLPGRTVFSWDAAPTLFCVKQMPK